MNTIPAHIIDPLLGVVLNGNYRANRFIGRGAMGTIYEGTHLRLNKRVALKVISRDLAGNPLALERFRREAEVTSQLGHPHIVNVFDFGTTPSGEPYMAMEYLEGEDLEARIRRGEKLPLGAVTLIVRQVASALSATHAGGIVHRDLKPANIFLVRVEDEPEFAKVVDFGISKVKAAGARITGGSVALGTPQFMSPEQAMGRLDEIDHRTDQWSLACIAYEALTGHSPFTGEDAVGLIYKVVHEAATLTARLHARASRGAGGRVPASPGQGAGRAFREHQRFRARVRGGGRSLRRRASPLAGAAFAGHRGPL